MVGVNPESGIPHGPCCSSSVKAVLRRIPPCTYLRRPQFLREHLRAGVCMCAHNNNDFIKSNQRAHEAHHIIKIMTTTTTAIPLARRLRSSSRTSLLRRRQQQQHRSSSSSPLLLAATARQQQQQPTTADDDDGGGDNNDHNCSPRPQLTPEARELAKVLQEKKNQNTNLTLVAQTAPAVRVAFSEAWGLPPGSFAPGLLVASLRELGFDLVLDTNTAADLTICEEGTELLHRVLNREEQ